MRITFIRPNLYDMRSSDALQPLVFSILKGLTPDDVETLFYDERLEAIPFNEATDLVAMTVETFTARRSYQIADEFRKRGVPVVMGGYHATFLPDEALEHADAVVIGDAEGLWEMVVEDTRTNSLQKIYRQDVHPGLKQLNYDRSIFRGKRYRPATPVQYGRGCRFACDFCSIHAFYGKDLRQRDIPEVIAEIKALSPHHVFLVDDNLFVDLDKARALFEALIPLKITWSCQVSIDITRHEDVLRLMRRSGCISALIGFESLNEDNLAQMKKKWNVKYGDYEVAIKKLKSLGIMLYGTFVFGYDHDTPDSFRTTLDFALRHNFFLANFNPLMPTPGAGLYDRLEKEGRLLYDKWWLAESYRYGDATFQPKNMTAKQLTDGCFMARKEFNYYNSIFRRAFSYRDNWFNPYRLGIFLASNVVARWEILDKQGRTLGGCSPA
ncbi:MAG: B12-binding domain-containing radical SAM protein [Calditrichia bacterium]